MSTSSQPLIVFGKHAIASVCVSRPSSIISARATTESLQELKNLFGQNGIKVPIHTISSAEIDELTESAVHQGMIVTIQRFPYADIADIIPQKKTLVLLDGIHDPHNVGAIIRSAAAFGAGAVLIPEHNQSPITGGVIKASVGTAFSIPVCMIGNVSQTLESLQKHGYWVAGLAGDGTTPLAELDTSDPLVIVIGNESKGIRQETRKRCDFVVSIPIASAVESLNASVSAAIVLWELARRTVQI